VQVLRRLPGGGALIVPKFLVKAGKPFYPLFRSNFELSRDFLGKLFNRNNNNISLLKDRNDADHLLDLRALTASADDLSNIAENFYNTNIKPRLANAPESLWEPGKNNPIQRMT
jgi:hypothetical protein